LWLFADAAGDEDGPVLPIKDLTEVLPAAKRPKLLHPPPPPPPPPPAAAPQQQRSTWSLVQLIGGALSCRLMMICGLSKLLRPAAAAKGLHTIVCGT
jgi:hypothetical protein